MALGLSKALLVATLMPARIFPEMENRPVALRPCRTEKISSLYSSGFPHEGFSHSVSTANFTLPHARPWKSKQDGAAPSFMGLAADERLSERSRCPQSPNR